MSYGVTTEGFVRPTFTEIRQSLIEEARAKLGPINVGAESAIGQEITARAERENSIWDAMEAVYLNQYRRSAAGLSLDGAVELTGVSRRPATSTIVNVELTGTPGTVISAGSQAETDDRDAFELIETVVLDGSAPGEGQMRAIEPGAVLALAGTLTNIVTPVAGWDGVNNATDGSTGRDVETDPDLRQRAALSLQVTGAGTVEAIRARILEQIDDVTAVTIIENRTDTVDFNGRPAHSFETVVAGGADADIGQLLWEIKPAGIETTGNEFYEATDSTGSPQPIRFSRAVQVFIWVDVVLTPSGEDNLPVNIQAVVADAIIDFTSSISVGDDVIYQSLFVPIYRDIPGVGMAAVTIGASNNIETEPAYASENIIIADNEIARFDQSRITVNVNA